MKPSQTIIASVAFILLCSNAIAQTQSAQQFKTADSLFLAQDWTAANTQYNNLSKTVSFDALHYNRLAFTQYNLGSLAEANNNYHKALDLRPTGVLRQVIFIRLARVYSLKGENEMAFIHLDSAISNGYNNFTEMDSLKDFRDLRKLAAFQKRRDQVFSQLYPCVADPRTKEFDFWIGEWDVVATTSKAIAGHSQIQRISGGCALLENWKSAVSEGKSLNFIDPATNKWKQVWIGSYPNGQQDFINGEYKEGAMRFTFETTDPQGHKLVGRFMFFNQGPNQVRQFNETSADDGKTWTTAYDFTYIRKK